MKLKLVHYGWVMAVISVIVLAAHAPAMYSFGIFLRPLTLEFNWDRGVISGAFSISLPLVGVLSILSGRLSDKYGPRITVTIGGMLTGIGFLLIHRLTHYGKYIYSGDSLWGLGVPVFSSP